MLTDVQTYTSLQKLCYVTLTWNGSQNPFDILKVHLKKNNNTVIIYSHSCCSKPA